MNPTRVPNGPVAVDWSHPLSNGLWGAYIPGGAQAQQNIAQRSPLVLATAGSIVATRWGPGSTAQLVDNFNAPWIFGSGATAFSPSIFWLGNVVNSTNAVNMVGGIYSNPNGNPYSTYGIGLNATTPTVNGLWNAADNYNSASTSGSVSIGNQSIGISFASNNTQTYNNGVIALGGLAGGFGNISYTDTSYFTIGAGNDSGSTALVLNYAIGLPSDFFAWLNAEPFALFKPMVRRRYYVPAATTGISGSGTLAAGAFGLSSGGTITNPGSGMLAVGALGMAGTGTARTAGSGTLAVGHLGMAGTSATGSVGSGALPIGAVRLGGVGTARISGSGMLALHAMRLAGSAATKLTGSGMLALGALVLSGIGPARTAGSGTLAVGRLGVAGIGTARAAGSGMLAVGRLGVAGAGGNSLSGAGTLALGAFGLNGSTAPTNSGTGTLSIGAFRLSTANLIPVPQIIYPPSVRVATPLGRPPVAWWSPRVAGDAEPFTVDFSPLLAAGEILTGTPTVIVPSADLSSGAITPSILALTTQSGIEITTQDGKLITVKQRFSYTSTVTFGLSGPGTTGKYSTVQATAATSNGQVMMLTAHVLTTPMLAGLPDPVMDIIGVPSPYFLPRAAGDTTSFAISLEEWLAETEAISGATVSCITGDLAVTPPIVTGSVVAWTASGTGTLHMPSAFLLSVTTNLRGPIGFYSYSKTEMN